MKKTASSWRPSQPAETPYSKAQQEWDRRMGGTTVQAANWRLATFAALALNLVSCLGLIYLGAQPKAVPHLIQVDRLGAPTYLGPIERATAKDFKPTPASLQYHLRRFVADTREISSDAAVLKHNWYDAYRLVTPNGANQLSAYVKGSDPFEKLQRQVRVSVQVNVVVQISRETWQVDWTETTWDDHGNPTDTAIWRGTLHVLLQVPDSEEQLATNPLGLFIDELHWARLTTTDGRTTTP
jgi:type IV secretion system protein VirB5